jgi:hypothetical protein
MSLPLAGRCGEGARLLLQRWPGRCGSSRGWLVWIGRGFDSTGDTTGGSHITAGHGPDRFDRGRLAAHPKGPQSALSPHRVRSRRLSRCPVYTVRDVVQFVVKEPGVDVKGRGGRRVAEHPLNGLDARAASDSEAGWPFPRFARRDLATVGA